MTEDFRRLLAATAERFADRMALVSNEGRLTRRDLDLRADTVVARLAARGLAPGDRLALTIGNTPEFVVALLAGWRCGATVAPLDPLLKDDERAAILADLSPAAVLDASDVADAPGPAGGVGRGGLAANASLSKPALVLYTSGSTGRPKGAVISHAALAFANRSWAHDVVALTPEDVVLATLPLSHSFGLNAGLLAPFLAGARVVLVERFSPEAALATIERDRVTVFPGVATMFRRVLDCPSLAEANLSSLRLCVSGAAPLPWDLACEWRERTGIRILRGYGTTELFRPVSYLARDPVERPHAAGRPVPGVEVRIVDDAGRTVPQGEAGELMIKTPAAMDAYLGAPEETREVLRDGWFSTGDLARITDGGFVEIVGRKRERILRGGYSVFPAEVEAVLLTHPAVAEAAVGGVAHPELGEEVAAFVVLKPGGAATTPDALVDYCRERLAGFKYPRRVTLVATLPRSSTGKVLKARLAAEAGTPVDER
ncbi:MAG: class I adenylate-forming enzyme family protein [Candidatus Rokuibacteriota bacterium]